MASEQTKDYTQIRNGKTVHVSGYNRDSGPSTDDIVRADPTRPPLASKRGTYARGRSVPGVFEVLATTEE